MLPRSRCLAAAWRIWLGICGRCGSFAGERTRPLRTLASTSGCLMSPFGSVESPFSRALLILSGPTSSSSLQPLGMLFGKSSALLERGGPPARNSWPPVRLTPVLARCCQWGRPSAASNLSSCRLGWPNDYELNIPRLRRATVRKPREVAKQHGLAVLHGVVRAQASHRGGGSGVSFRIQCRTRSHHLAKQQGRRHLRHTSAAWPLIDNETVPGLSLRGHAALTSPAVALPGLA